MEAMGITAIPETHAVARTTIQIRIPIETTATIATGIPTPATPEIPVVIIIPVVRAATGRLAEVASEVEAEVAAVAEAAVDKTLNTD